MVSGLLHPDDDFFFFLRCKRCVSCSLVDILTGRRIRKENEADSRQILAARCHESVSGILRFFARSPDRSKNL
jgi:hypothetical protein